MRCSNRAPAGNRGATIPGPMFRKGAQMLWIIFVVLLILWLMGMISGFVISGFIHILLVIAVVVVLIRIIQGRRPL